MKLNKETLRKLVLGKLNEEIDLTKKTSDHEASMAKAELRSLHDNVKKLYPMIEHGDELPGWVSSYITLASDYLNSVTQYMSEQKSGGSQLDESTEGGGKGFKDLVAQYDLTPTGNGGKFKFDDFQPILDDGSNKDKFVLAMILADKFLLKNIGLGWDDLPDTNSLWPAVENSETMKDLVENIKEACKERMEEDMGMFDEGWEE